MGQTYDDLLIRLESEIMANAALRMKLHKTHGDCAEALFNQMAKYEARLSLAEQVVKRAGYIADLLEPHYYEESVLFRELIRAYSAATKEGG